MTDIPLRVSSIPILLLSLRGYGVLLKTNDMNELIETIVGAIQDKKGKDIVSLDLSGFDGAICSHFVVCNADSTTQVAAIADGIEETVQQKLGQNVWRVEGKQTGLWVAMDYLDVVVHIFTQEGRDFYDLDRLWADGKKLDWQTAEGA